MADDKKLDALTNQIAQLVDHVAEVRRQNARSTKQLDQVQADMKSMQVNMELL